MVTRYREQIERVSVLKLLSLSFLLMHSRSHQGEEIFPADWAERSPPVLVVFISVTKTVCMKNIIKLSDFRAGRNKCFVKITALLSHVLPFSRKISATAVPYSPLPHHNPQSPPPTPLGGGAVTKFSLKPSLPLSSKMAAICKSLHGVDISRSIFQVFSTV